MEKLNIKFQNLRTQNGGYITATGPISNEVGRLTYTIQAEQNVMIISYVMVITKYEGLGFGKALVNEAVKFARKNKYKIYPHCGFAKSVLEREKNAVSDVYP